MRPGHGHARLRGPLRRRQRGAVRLRSALAGQCGGKQDFSVDPSAGRTGGGLVVVIHDGPTTSHNTWLTKKIMRESVLRRVRLDFDFRVVDVAHGYAVMGALFFDPGNANGLALRALSDAVGVGASEAYGKKVFGQLFSDDVVGAWHHATTCIELSPASNALARRVVLVDDVVFDDVEVRVE